MNSDYLVGTVLENRYEVQEMIGSGGMATVYKAKCNMLNRYVAIKVLKDSLKYDSEVVKRFNAEARAAAKLSHPNIVQVFDVSEKGDIDYIVMEYIDGITLKDYISKKGVLPWEEACNFAVQIGKALECAHKNHIIHKDIKPHNVMLTRDGILKVTDFGIAQAATTDTLVAGDSNMGSVHYISPEQARGGYVDEKSDIYSLGVVLYEMLTGILPFDGGSAVNIALMKLEKEPADCRTINPDIPDNVGKITMKALSKEQHLRYQSASEMVGDLERVLRAKKINDESDGSGRKFKTKDLSGITKIREKRQQRKTRKRNRNILTLLAIVAIFLIAFATYSFMSGGRQEYQVPEIIGMTLEEAEDALSAANLQLDKNVTLEVSEEFEEGIIMKQSPGANQYVKKNRKIKVTVSSGTKIGEIVLPSVENMPYDDALERLQLEGVKCTKVERESEAINKGYVISQSPKEGTKVPEGYTVTLYVSSGKPENDEDEEKKEEEKQKEEEENKEQQKKSGTVIVPKLRGLMESQAEEELEKVGLSLGSIKEEDSTSPIGTVISQNPVESKEVEKGGKVNIVISRGTEAQRKTENPNAGAEEANMKKKTLTVTIPDDADGVVNIKVVANGKVIHNQNHQKEEGTVDILVQSSKDASVQVYIDDVQVVDKVINFE